MKTMIPMDDFITYDHIRAKRIRIKLNINVMMTLEERVLEYINNHPGGVKISEMEAPFGESRMKLGFIAKNLLEKGMIQKVDAAYYPKIYKVG